MAVQTGRPSTYASHEEARGQRWLFVGLDVFSKNTILILAIYGLVTYGSRIAD